MSRLPALNDDQSAVARRLEGDAAVAAGAGSGKTRVLAERFAERVLADEARDPAAADLSRVLLITFTDKAAGELAERVRRVFLDRERADLARRVDQAWISTIHGFCQRIVRRHALDIGIDPGFTVLAEPEVGVVRHEAFEQAALAPPPADEADVSRLLGQHGVETVRAAVVDGLDRIRAMGCSGGDVALPEASDVRVALGACHSRLEAVLEGYRAETPTETLESNTEAIRGLVAALGSIGLSERVPSAEEVLRASAGFSVKKYGSEDVKELTQSARDAVEALRTAAAGVVARQDAEGFAALLRSYESTYAEAKRARNSLDFEDLQLIAARLFQEHPRIAQRYARQFSIVMVDEFQDTNALQVRVIAPIAEGKLCVVGDECQSIYGFRFADVQVFRDLRDAMSAKDADAYHPLATNYRTHEDLLATINRMFGHTTFFGEDFLKLLPGSARETDVSWPEGVPRAEVLLVDNEGWGDLHWREAEAAAVAARIRELVDSGVAAPGDVVLLLRAMTNARTYIRALERQGLRVYAESGGGFFASPEVADLRALLRVMVDRQDGAAVVELLAGGLGALSDDGLCRLAWLAGPRGDLWAALGSAETVGLGDEDAARARLIFDTVEDLGRSFARRTLADTTSAAVATLAPGGGCYSRDAAWANARKVARLAAAYEQIVPADPAAFLSYLDDREMYVKRERSAGIAVEGADAVRVMSVHAAKGLEFPIVVFADLGHHGRTGSDRLLVVGGEKGPEIACRPSAEWGEGLVPKSYAEALARRAADEMAEAKRVFYVACTRAEQALILVGSCKLSQPPQEALAIDWVRTALLGEGETSDASLADVSVERIGPDDEARLLEAAKARAKRVSRRKRPAPILETLETESAGASTSLSHTKLEQFATCPYRFFAESVLGIGKLEVPLPGEPDPLVFGSAVHVALQGFAEGGTLTRERALAIATASGLDEDAASRLEQCVEAYAGTAVATRAKAAGARPEVPFAVPVGSGLLVGSMDLYALRDGRALIVDYKTGETEGGSKAGERHRRQAERYAFAALADGAQRVEVVFVEVEAGGRETAFEFDSADAASLEEELQRAFAAVSGSAFEPLEHYEERTCLRCPGRGSFCTIVGPEGD